MYLGETTWNNGSRRGLFHAVDAAAETMGRHRFREAFTRVTRF